MANVLVIENLIADLNHPEILTSLFDKVLNKDDSGIVLHLPRPTSVTSLYLDAINEAAKKAALQRHPFFAVVHPKLRLLMSLFQLEDLINTAPNLNDAIAAVTELAKDYE